MKIGPAFQSFVCVKWIKQSKPFATIAKEWTQNQYALLICIPGIKAHNLRNVCTSGFAFCSVEFR